MRRTISIVLVVGGIAMIVLPWLCNRYYIGPLTSLVVRTQSGDPALFLDLSDILENCTIFGVLTSLAGVAIAFLRFKE
jgi:hypothetical protein